jgi:hypothetical protein
MKKLVAALTLFLGLQANAGVISIELSNDNVNVGDVVEVTVLGTGFDAFDTLNVDIEFDTGLFSVDELSLGGDLFAADPFASFFSAQAFGAAFSFLSFDLFAGGDFTIATFDVTAIAAGETEFLLTNILASDFLLGPVDAVEADEDVIAEVSAPATLGLFVIALMGLCGLRRQA